MNIKIAIIGPESTGKTELAILLAKHYGANWIPELAREYIENKNFHYEFEDVVEIAQLQIKQENELRCANEANICFVDTDLIVTKVWFEHKYKEVPDFVTQYLENRNISFYLLCAPDIPWEFDPVRENGDNREFFFDWYESEVKSLGTDYAVIAGLGELRLEHAIKAVDDFLIKSKK